LALIIALTTVVKTDLHIPLKITLTICNLDHLAPTKIALTVAFTIALIIPLTVALAGALI